MSHLTGFDENLISQSKTKVSSNSSVDIPQVRQPVLANMVQNSDISVQSLSDKGDKLYL